MNFFLFKDKNQNFEITGMSPHNDVDCPPFDYFRLCHAKMVANMFAKVLKLKSPIPIPDYMVNKYALEETDKMIAEQFEKSKPNETLTKVLSDGTLTKKQQMDMLQGLTISASDLLWFNKEAQEMGYLLNVYHVERYPDKFDEKKKPACFHANEDKSVTKIGNTEMTDGELRAVIEQRKVVQARLYYNGEHWHCFFFTFKGLSGLEHGEYGSKPHYHYWSDKCGMSLDKFIDCINSCKMPASEVHIIVDRS